jgi:O-acetylhomoserine/O-acetylserine sulfhydrylase-like pyridoxal-dependent enzyme
MVKTKAKAGKIVLISMMYRMFTEIELLALIMAKPIENDNFAADCLKNVKKIGGVAWQNLTESVDG